MRPRWISYICDALSASAKFSFKKLAQIHLSSYLHSNSEEHSRSNLSRPCSFPASASWCVKSNCLKRSNYLKFRVSVSPVTFYDDEKWSWIRTEALWVAQAFRRMLQWQAVDQHGPWTKSFCNGHSGVRFYHAYNKESLLFPSAVDDCTSTLRQGNLSVE